MNIYKKIEKILAKNFTDKEVLKIIGQHQKSYLAYANDVNIRKNAASGGVVSTILIQLLKNNIIDGALVCKSEIISHKVRAKFFIATTKDEILQAQGSKYVATKFGSQAMPLIKEFGGRLAVVGLPCDLSMLKIKSINNKQIESKIILTIALACGHNSQAKLIDTITHKFETHAKSQLIGYRFRKGVWRGSLEANFTNGKNIIKSFSHFADYQNLFFFSEKKCLFCNDHFGYNADISIGDEWSYDLKQSGIKQSGIIIKTQNANSVFDKILNSNCLEIKTIDTKIVLEGQKRAAPFHYNISARHKVGKLFGINISDKIHEKVKWHEYIVAFIVLFNWKWSQSKRYNKYIFKIPKIFLKIYLYLFKGLESLK